MVKVGEITGLNVFFWVNEEGGRGILEPPHVHVCEGKQHENATKFWLDPVRLEHNGSRLTNPQLKRAEDYINLNRRDFLAK